MPQLLFHPIDVEIARINAEERLRHDRWRRRKKLRKQMRERAQARALFLALLEARLEQSLLTFKQFPNIEKAYRRILQR